MTEGVRRRACKRGGTVVARSIVLDAEHRLEPGELSWDERGVITSLRRARGKASDLVVLPGLVDAHVHLQIDPLPSASREFVPWVRGVMAARAADSARDEVDRIRRSARALLGEGVTAVGEIDATGRSFAALAGSPMRGRVYRELTGYHLDPRAARSLVRSRSSPGRDGLHTGLSPHAPYSAGAALLGAARATGRPLAIHCAETEEEQRFLRSGDGPFADLLSHLGRLPRGHRPPGVGAVRWLDRLGALGPSTQLVHCQELERGDAQRIAAAGSPVVVCPGTIEWFRREAPPVRRWLDAGIQVALGTDSRASNTGLSMRHELRLAAKLWPELSPSTLFTMATTAGARALGIPGLGRLRRGGRADFFVLRLAGRGPVLDEFVVGRGDVVSVRVRGVAVPELALRR